MTPFFLRPWACAFVPFVLAASAATAMPGPNTAPSALTEPTAALTQLPLAPTKTNTPVTKAATPANQNAPKQAPPYRPYHAIRPRLNAVKIPVLLPRPGDVARFIVHRNLVDANLFRATANGYTIFFEYTPDCQGAPMCTAATLYGARLTPGKTLPFNPATYPQKIDTNEHQSMTLKNGITAQLERQQVDTNPNATVLTLTFIQNNAVYQITLNHGNQKALVALANSAVQ